MWKKMNKVCSSILMIVMIVTILPLHTFAVENGATVIIPIGESESNKPQSNGNNVRIRSLSSITPIYISSGAVSTSLGSINKPDDITSKVEARIQAVDVYNTVVAQTTSFTIYEWDTTIGNKTLFLLDLLEEGSYPLQVVYGDVQNPVTVPLNYSLTVVDAPVITYGHILNLAAGTNPFQIVLEVTGYDGNADNFSFSLLDESENGIYCTATHMGTYGYNYNVTRITYSVEPQSSITANMQYSLKISTKSGGLYSNISNISTKASEKISPEIAILEVTPDDKEMGGLIIKVGGVNDKDEYTVTVAQGRSSSSDNYVYKGTESPVMENGNGIFYITLTKNELVLPLSAYGDTHFYIEISDSEGNEDKLYFYNRDFYDNQYSRLSLDKVSDTKYAFTLTGENMLLDLYETDDLSFTLKKYVSGSGYTEVGTTTGTISKSNYTDKDSIFFEFTGTFNTDEELFNGTTYYIFHEDENLAQTSIISGEQATTLDISRLNVNCFDYETKTFYFNFEQCPVDVTLTGSASTATAQLYDLTTEKIVSETETVSGVLNSDGNYEFSFIITKPPILDTTHDYIIRFVSDGKTITSDKFSSTYAVIKYDDSILFPNSYRIMKPVFAGDTSLVFRFYMSDFKNITLDYFKENPIDIVNEANETSLLYTPGSSICKNYYWYLTLDLAVPITFGTYRYQSYNTFKALPSNIPVLGGTGVDSETRTISIIDCSNLSDSEYTAVLYDTAENGYGKLADLTLLLKDSNTLVVSDGLPADLANGSYTVEVRSDGFYLGTVYLHINWNSDDIIKCIIKGYHLQYDGTYYRMVEITYQTTNEEIYIYTNNPGYSHVRYSEDISFSDATYSTVRQYYNQPFKLSDGNGTKTIYVQFKAPDGKESEIYTWSCEKVEKIIEPSIIDAWISIDDTETMFIPDNTDFTINIISNSQLSDAYVEFVKTGGSIYYEQFPLVYQGPVEKGYLFQKDFNSDDFIFRYYDFKTINCYLTDIKGDEQEKKSLPVMFGELENIYFTEWDLYRGIVYTNQTSYDVKGYASPDSTVTITCNDQEFITTANSVGFFVITINIADEGEYKITAQDNKGLTTYDYRDFYLKSDRTAPIIDTLKATTVDGNIILSWSTSSDDVAYYLIWKDDAAVKRVSDNYTSTNYITAGGIGSTFKVVAVDWAGNQSEAKIVTTGDTEPPTAPGTPTITKRGTKSIAFGWAASTDNVAVHKYEIYRDDDLIDTVGYSTLSYNDTDLVENTEYQYKIYALDRAGNRSDAAKASLSTAALIISTSTIFDSEYIKEEKPDGVGVSMTLDTSDDLYFVTDVVTKLQYKLQTAENWSELELIGTSGSRSGTWTIEELPIGEYAVRFYAIDTEGTEKTTAEVTVEINHDMEPPTITIYTPSESEILSGKDLEISGFSADNVEVNRIELSYSIDGGSNFTDITTLINEKTSGRKNYDWTYIFDATALPSGEIVIKAVAYDGRENRGETTVSFILDNTPPDTPYGFYISGTDEYIGILWSYPDQELDSDFSGFRVYRADSIDGEYSMISEQEKINYFDTVEKGIVANTRYYYYVTAVDIRGNESEPTVTLSGIIETDLTPPTIASYLPRQGEELCNTATLSVSLYDNSLLKHLDIKYREVGSTDWIDLATLLTDEVSAVLTYIWDVGNLDVGNYQVKLTAEDISGLTSEQIVTYTIRAYALPVTPTNVSATAAGHREIALAWDYTGDSSLLTGFRILRKGHSEEEYTSVKYIKDAAATSYIDSGLAIGEEFSYKIEAVDKWDATAESSVVSALAPSNDTENPVAVIAATGLTIAKDKTITLTGSGSTDNDELASYSWDFGDGNIGAGVTVSHAYTSAGTYTVKLGVADLAGNTDTDTVTLEVVDLSITKDMHEITLNIIDSSTTDPLEGAEIKIRNRNIPEDLETTDIILATDSNGQASIVLKDGDYSIQTIYDSYLLRTNNISVSADSDKSITVGMARSNMLVGSLTSTEMTLQEIKEAGIDIEDPDNQHVYKFAAVLEFTPVKNQTYSIPINYFINNKGSILGYGAGWGGGFGGCFGGWNIGIFPISKNVYLIIYGEACWLKEMFHVQLLLTNTSTTDYIEDCHAELTLPEGLSLASMLSNAGSQNSAIQKVNETGTIAEQENATVDWYVRGDKEGEYNLIATVEGTYMPNPEPFIVTYITENPIKVWAGSALHMYVEADKYAMKGWDYKVNFRLENVSSKSIYNLSLDILGGKFASDYSIEDLEYEGTGADLEGTWNDGATLKTTELAPGQSIEGVFTIRFEHDIIEKNIVYMLNSMFGHTREGSTTEIPMTLVLVDNFFWYLNYSGKANYVSRFNYTDDYFKNTSYYYNHDLAIMSLNLAMSAFNKYGVAYINASDNVNDLLTKIGFEGFDTNNGFKIQPSTDSIGVAAANKQIKTAEGDYTLIALAIRGGGYEREWASNFTIGKEKSNHQGFREARDEVIKFLRQYIFSKEITGNIKIWITGYSRAAATANLTAARLMDNHLALSGLNISLVPEDIFAYCFATPMGTTINNKDSLYLNIINIVNPNDPVTMVAPAKWGYSRYGATFYLPSSLSELNYQSYLDNMLNEYYKLGGMKDKGYGVDNFVMCAKIIPVCSQEYFFERFIPFLTEYILISPDIYTELFQNNMRSIGETLGKKGFILEYVNWTSAWILIELEHLRPDYLDTLIINFDRLGEAHYPELYLAWMRSIEGNIHTNYSNGKYYRLCLNCPVDVDVYDADGNLIAGFVNDIPQNITGSTIFSILDEDGQKVICLPYGLDYTIVINSTGNGMMTYTIGEYSPESGSMTRIVNYYDIPISEGNTLTGIITSPVGEGSTIYTLTGNDGIEIQKSKELSGDDIEHCNLTIITEGAGEVSGYGLRYEGEYALVTATPDPGYAFKGWYHGSTLVSSDVNYRVCVLSDVTLTAVFEKIGSSNGNGHKGGSGDSGTSAITGSATEAKPTIEHNDGGDITIDENGNVEIVPDDGYIVKEIYINGELVTTEALKNLKVTDKVEVVFEKVAEWVNPFTDVSESDWFYEAVKYVSMNNLMVGTGDETFEPNTTLSRAMLVTILWRLEGEPEPLGFNPFTDLTQDWYKDAVIWASENGIIMGYGNNIFAPDDNLTREQMATVLYRYSQFKGYDVSAKSNLAGYNDISEISDWALDAMRWANSNGLIVGRSPSILAPKGTATRAEIATVIKRYLQR